MRRTLIRWRYRGLWSLWRNRHNFIWVPPDWPDVVTIEAEVRHD